jgi:hypothetical protein
LNHRRGHMFISCFRRLALAAPARSNKKMADEMEFFTLRSWRQEVFR